MPETYSDYGIFVTETGGEVDTTCPQCSSQRKKSREKCLSVNTGDGTWFCHHCGWSGSLKRRSEWQASRPRHKEYAKPTYQPPLELPDEVFDWFASRGIAPDTIIKEGIGYEDGWIKFPYYRNDEIVNVKSRKLKEKSFFQEPGAEKILYGMVNRSESEREQPATLIWVEGEIDRLSFLEAGFKYVVSVPDGAPSPNTKTFANKFEYLENCESYIRQFREHVLAVDGDRPGDRLREELARRIGMERCLRIEWPAGCKDANEVLVKHGKQTLNDVIAAAKFFPVEGIFSVRDVMPDTARLYDEGMQRGALTGWATVDKFLSIRKGELCILTGIPSSGKSSWLDALTMNLAQTEGWKFGVFSPENAPTSQHIKKLAELYVGKPFFSGKEDRMSPTEVIEACKFLDEHFYFINPKDDALNIDEILDKARVLVFRHGIDFLIIDPYNDIDHSRQNTQSETEHVSVLLSKCQRFARMNNVFVCIVAHPTKLRKDDRTGLYPCPTPYDISGSAHFRNRADVCLACHRPDLTRDIIELHIQKIRFKEIGQPGMVLLDYNRSCGRFFEHMGTYPKQRRTIAERKREAISEIEMARRVFHGEGDGDMG